MPADDPLTPEELAFRALLEDPAALHAFATEARQRWETTKTGRDHVARCYREVGGFRQKPQEGKRNGT